MYVKIIRFWNNQISLSGTGNISMVKATEVMLMFYVDN